MTRGTWVLPKWFFGPSPQPEGTPGDYIVEGNSNFRFPKKVSSDFALSYLALNYSHKYSKKVDKYCQGTQKWYPQILVLFSFSSNFQGPKLLPQVLKKGGKILPRHPGTW